MTIIYIMYYVCVSRIIYNIITHKGEGEGGGSNPWHKGVRAEQTVKRFSFNSRS